MRAMNKVGGLFIGLLCVVSCGSPQKAGGGGGGDGSSGSSGGGGVAFQSGGPVTPENVCTRIFALKDARCELASGYTLSFDECKDEMNRSLEERGPEARQATTQAARCLLDNESCDAVGSCMTALNPYSDEQDGSPTEFRTCAQTDVYAPVGVPRADWEKRRGANAKRYSEVSSSESPSTKEEPVEVCGIPAEMEWLLAAKCNDGSMPFADYDHAHAARVGNVGPGGSCGSIIDLYEVPCPEGTYSIYIDAYVCAQD
jgi:hypothetical protein